MPKSKEYKEVVFVNSGEEESVASLGGLEHARFMTFFNEHLGPQVALSVPCNEEQISPDTYGILSFLSDDNEEFQGTDSGYWCGFAGKVKELPYVVGGWGGPLMSALSVLYVSLYQVPRWKAILPGHVFSSDELHEPAQPRYAGVK